MYYLALETSITFSLALFKDSSLLGKSDINKSDLIISDNILKEIDSLLSNHNLELGDISTIVVSRGPGFFTSIRVAIALVKMFQLALKIEVVAIPSSFIMSFECSEKYSLEDDSLIVSIIKIGSKGFIAAVYDKKYNLIMEDTYFESKLEDFLSKYNTKLYLVGNGISSNDSLPNNAILLKDITSPNSKVMNKDIVYVYKKKFKNEFGQEVIPLYVKNFEVSK